MQELISEIKKKKELFGLADQFVASVLDKIIRTNNVKFPLSKADKKLIIKEARRELRLSSGRFHLKDAKKLLDEEKYDELLSLHSSTKERLPYYKEVEKLVYSSNPKIILDLGCGLNPLALAKKGTQYIASDINQSDLDIVQQYFSKKNISGESIYYDLRSNKNLPKADVCLMFKVLDVIEKKGHKLAEKVIKELNCKVIIVSFSTKTLSGKPMNHPQRGWIEQMLKRLGHNFSTFQIKNEIFYIIEKH